MKFEWVWCRHCERPAIICPKCGNNCCNGGTGVVDGKHCGCEEAYKFQHEEIANGREPEREGLREFGKTIEEIMEGINNLPTISPE